MTLAILAALACLCWPSTQKPEPDFQVSTSLDVAYAMDLLAFALSGGAPVVQALEAVTAASKQSTPEVAAALSRVAAAMRWGVGDAQAWAVAPPAWQPAASAFALASRAGAAPSGLLREAARDLRTAEAERVAIAGAKVGVRVVLPLGLCFLPAFILMTIVPMVLGLIRLH